jgi:hypothetical protein
MMRWLEILGGSIVVLAIALPFFHDAWAWYNIRNHYSLNHTQQQALADWNGSPAAFLEMLRDQCQRQGTADDTACLQYR